MNMDNTFVFKIDVEKVVWKLCKQIWREELKRTNHQIVKKSTYLKSQINSLSDF